MTLIVGASLGDCAILAADRATFFVGPGFSHMTETQERKITITRNGGIAASGFVGLLDPVKRRFASESPETVGEMIEIIEAEQMAFLRHHNHAPDAVDWARKTSWKITLPLKEGVIAAQYSFKDGAFIGAPPGHALFTYPPAISIASRALVAGAVREALNDDDPQRIVKAIASAVEHLHDCGEPVSRVVDFLIHSGAGMMEINSNDLHR